MQTNKQKEFERVARTYLTDPEARTQQIAYRMLTIYHGQPDSPRLVGKLTVRFGEDGKRRARYAVLDGDSYYDIDVSLDYDRRPCRNCMRFEVRREDYQCEACGERHADLA